MPETMNEISLKKQVEELKGTVEQLQQSILQLEQQNSLPAPIQDLQNQVSQLKKEVAKDKVSMVVFSGDLDRVLGAFVIATGAAAMGTEVAMFFTFWGTPVLRDPNKSVSGKDIFGKMFGKMLPKGTSKVKLSQMNMGGLGKAMIKFLMKKKNISSLEDMLSLSEEMGVNIRICEMSMDLMGMKREEIIDFDNLSYCGAAKFLEDACESKATLFI